MDACLGCFLALLFLIPAIVYMLAVAGKTTRVTLAVHPVEGGRSRLLVGGDDRQGIAHLTQWAITLPTRPEALASTAEEPELLQPSGPSLTDKLRELTELRDQGLITQEEFEAKKAELLGRM